MFHVIVFTFATQLTLTAIVLLNFSTAEAYIYRPGNQCPRPTDIGDGFDMDRFLGHWYVVQRSRSPMPASCMVYNITRQPPSEDDDVDNAEQNHYRIEQITYFRPAERKYKLTYAGKLEAKTAANRGNNGTASSRMSVKFPMNVIGRLTFDVFATDYTGFAGIFTCQPLLLFMRRQSATFLSRTPTLSAETRKMLRYRLYDDHIDALAMEDVSQEDCEDDGRTEKEMKVHLLSTTTEKPKRVNEDIVFPEEVANELANVTTSDGHNGNASHIDSQLIWI